MNVVYKRIPNAHLKSVCGYGKGVFTCKYIMFYKDGFYCVKKEKEIKEAIDAQKEMKAKGNNCNGL